MSKSTGIREVACFAPDVPQGSDHVQSNDFTIDDRGMLILERT